MIRTPAVAHQFYPGDAEVLRELLTRLVPQTTTTTQSRPARAVIMPHAGYVYSGKVAGETVARVTIPEDVVVMGPNHHGLGAPAALMTTGSWEMPLGEVKINAELAALIRRHGPEISDDERAHLREHSLEVLLPFLQFRQPGLRMVPLCLARLSLADCRLIGRALAAALDDYQQPVLLAASTDMSHYETRAAATAKDHLAIERVLALDPEGLYQTVAERQISMCGVIPTVITLFAALATGATEAELVRYSDSGEASGDTSQVVGYAGFVIR
ncbi:AmmeMemoRadiSam system protein B [Desulfurivibrio dismutans]|uniref:AmmeMemoRadiSam system protein B n=1 Tax=Desulfurivibrio dismutans TaxID=1398908 RepID=UPI0023DBFC50|nr:AmmeMemoRadiSam system protein B [Desulfurivibrio alkaliphilus]MDF1615336.1 AmmeMemoRadiSam system protein B [Desulfurivibrio alkaliphilus]